MQIRNGCNNKYMNLSPFHTYLDKNIFESATFFLSRYSFLPHVSCESGLWIRNFFNPLSRVGMFEYAMNTESCGH